MHTESTAQRIRRASRQSVAAIFIMASLSLQSRAVFAEQPVFAAAGPAVVHRVVQSPLHDAMVRQSTRLAQSPAPFSQAPDQRQRWVVRHPVITGTLIGTAGGAVVAKTPVGGAAYDPRVMLIGTAVGAWSGTIASAVHSARARKPVGRGVKTAIIAGAISIVVLPVAACYGAGGCGGVS